MNFFYGDLYITGNFTVNGYLRFRDDLIQESTLKYVVKGDLVIEGDVTIVGHITVGGSIIVLQVDSTDSDDNQSS